MSNRKNLKKKFPRINQRAKLSNLTFKKIRCRLMKATSKKITIERKFDIDPFYKISSKKVSSFRIISNIFLSFSFHFLRSLKAEFDDFHNSKNPLTLSKKQLNKKKQSKTLDKKVFKKEYLEK